MWKHVMVGVKPGYSICHTQGEAIVYVGEMLVAKVMMMMLRTVRSLLYK